jgi:hypothetical protein
VEYFAGKYDVIGNRGGGMPVVKLLSPLLVWGVKPYF